MKKLFVLFFALAMPILSFSHQEQQLTLEERVAKLEKVPNPPVLCGEKGIGLFFTGEALYWKTVQEGLDYAVKADFDLSVSDAGGGTIFYDNNVRNGKAHKPNFNYDWGFRIGLGYVIPRDYWDVYVNWTRLHTKATDSVSVNGNINPNEFLELLTTGSTSGSFVSTFWVAKLFSNPNLMNKGKARWYLDLDMIDAELGRNFYVGEFLAVRPYIGLRNAWIDQKYALTFEAQDYFNFPPNPDQLARRINVRMKNDFWGIGSKAGLNTEWSLGKGFCIYGKGAVSLLYGRFKVKYHLHDEKPIRTTEFITGGSVPGAQAPLPVTNSVNPYDGEYEMDKKIYTVAPIVDLALGLCWGRSFSEDRYCLRIWAGYEQSVFFNQNRFMNPQYDFTLIELTPAFSSTSEGPNFFTDRGNLTTSGFTGGASFAF